MVSSLLLAAVIPMSVMADDDGYERRGYGQGHGMMGGGEYGYGMMRGGYYDDDYQQIPEKEAKEKFEKFVEKHLKGFKITKIDKQRMPMGAMYWAILKDDNGNEFELHLNPHGYIRGPFVK